MRVRLAILFCCATLAVSLLRPTVSAIPHVSNQTNSLEEKLVGAWRLVSVETFRPSGEVIYPFYGKHPEGILMYDRSGWMSVQIVSDPKPTMPRVDSREAFLGAPAAEKVS